ncbi:unnamed protein product [Closterium sp. NIES-54]
MVFRLHSEIPDHPISSHRVPPRQVKLKHKRIQLPSASIQAMASSSDFPFVSGSCGFPDTRADADECMADLAKFPALSARRGSASARKLACLAHNYLRPWMGIPGVTAGMGARGMINPAMLQQMGTMANVLSCAGHVRIVRGKIFFRFGNFEFDWYRLRRFVFSVKLIQDAIREYKLHNLNAEFFLNTCDMYISKASSVAKPLAGLPIFSVHGAPGSIDILYPDPVDLSSNYFREAENETPWEQKESRAVFRGGMTNYKVIYPKHWRGSPRFRVHRMSDVRPDLLDARVVGGVDPEYRAGLRQDSISFGKRLGPTDMQGYKYELDVDGGTGSGRVCGVLSSSQMLIKQASEYTQFFDPLMCPYRHFLPTHRFFSDLFGRIEWARRNDGEARRIVRQANELASDVCTFDGRQLYWAILLAKYSVSALEDNHNITQPPLFTCTAPPTQGDFAHVLKMQTSRPFDGKDFFTWSFEFELMMEGAQILGFFDGSLPYPTNGTQYEKQQYTYQSMMAYTILLRNITPTQQQNIRSYRGYGNSAELVYNHLKSLPFSELTEEFPKQRSAPKSTPSNKTWICKKNDIKRRHQHQNSRSTLSDATTTITTGTNNRNQYLRSATSAKLQDTRVRTAQIVNSQQLHSGNFDLQAAKSPQRKQIPRLRFKPQREHQLRRDVVITVANNQNLRTRRQGVVQLQSRETNVILQMSKVLIAEGLGYNLLSVSQLMAKGIHLEADSTTQEFKLYHGRGGLYIGKAVLKNNVFVLDFVPDLGTADSDAIVNFTNWTHPPDLDPDFSPEGFWYSHTIPEAERTRALATIQTTSAAAETSSAATEPSATPTTLTTPVASSSTSPHIDNTSPTPAQQLTPTPREVHRSANFTAAFYSNSDLYRPYAPLEKVYSDILYNREPGQGAYSYTITFIDAATRYVLHLNLPSKDMAFEAFIAWLPVAERESDVKLKSFQSDGGGEYTSQRFKQFLAEKGIKRLVSLPYAHQQQGVAERLNRTLQNTMRKLLRGMRLPNHQWPKAMDHAVILHNLLSSSSLPNNASPHLLWTGKQGSTKMLRVFGCMTKADGTIDKFKAHWVVRGFDQEHGRDFTETFAPVSRHTSLRILLAVAAMKKKKLRQIDVANAFLYAPVDAEIYVELPHGSHGEPNQVCQVQKSLYGIKQAPGLWQQYLHARLTRIGFKQLPHDQGMYRLSKDDDYILLIVYVDDLLYIGSTDSVTTWFEGELEKDLTLTVSSTVMQYLGLNIQEGEDAIYLNAAKYADTIAKRFALTPTTISTPYRYTDEIEKGRLELSYCPTSEMAADYLTKKLGKSKFEYCMLLSRQSHVTCSDTPEAKGSVGNN